MDEDRGDAAPERHEVPDDAEGDTWTCPLPDSHGRFHEAHYFLHRIEEHYHEPVLLRFYLNAFIAALRAVHELLSRELERRGHAKWWSTRRREFVEDDVLSRFARGRNISLHQRTLLRGSRVTVGLFRGRRLKLAMTSDVRSDESSAALLERMSPAAFRLFLDEEHSAIGEQLGVKRLYFVAELSEEEDVLRACRRALARTTRALSEAHNRLGAHQEPATDDELLDESELEAITVLLESDIDPDAPARWGWWTPDESDD